MAVKVQIWGCPDGKYRASVQTENGAVFTKFYEYRPRPKEVEDDYLDYITDEK